MISNTSSALSSFWLLNKKEMKLFFTKLLASEDRDALPALFEAISEYSSKGKIWRWMESRMTKDYSLMPITVAKEARKRFKLPKAVEPRLYYKARKIKNKLAVRKHRKKQQDQGGDPTPNGNSK